ncbi:DNL zinc finger domain-containing protein [Cryptosporidium serpentis]
MSLPITLLRYNFLARMCNIAKRAYLGRQACTRSFSCISLPKYSNLLNSIRGTTNHGPEGTYILSCKCNKCQNPIIKKFSKHSYHNGVVIIRCDGCNNLHLIADHLGWFGNSSNIDIFSILKEKEAQFDSDNLCVVNQ